MRTCYSIILILSLLFVTGIVAAQEDDTGDDSSGENTVNYFFAACETQAVFNLDGFMNPGFDLYVEVTRDAAANGEQLVNRTRVRVDGNYQVSPQLDYINDQTVLLGQFASAEIIIAPEGNPDDPAFSDVISDSQDSCIEPSYGAADTTDSGTGVGDSPAPGTIIDSSGIYTPDGGVLNEVFAAPQESIVQIGARPSENAARVTGRTSDPGLIFAECNDFPKADPGRLFDTDNLIVFWSWFAATPELVRDHIANAQYEVFLTSDYAFRQPFPDVNVSPVVQREDGNYYVFYTANLGDGFRPGDYSVSFYLTWDTVIDDGYQLFGPGTDTPSMTSGCEFDVEINPFGIKTDLNNPTAPLQQ